MKVSGLGAISIKNSTFIFSNIELYSPASIEMDEKSALSANGTGYMKGPGFLNNK